MRRRSWIVNVFLLPAFGVASTEQPLSPDRAFWMRARSVGRDVLAVDFRTEPGYILYADRFAFQIDGKEVKFELPNAMVRFDKALGKRVAYYEGDFSAILRFKLTSRQVGLSVFAQGCAVEWGVCYPPMRRDFMVG